MDGHRVGAHGQRKWYNRSAEACSSRAFPTAIWPKLCQIGGRDKSLLRGLCGRDFEDCEHYLRVYIRHVRQKLERDPANPRFLVTVRGIGYRLADTGRSRPFSEQRARRPARALTASEPASFRPSAPKTERFDYWS